MGYLKTVRMWRKWKEEYWIREKRHNSWYWNGNNRANEFSIKLKNLSEKLFHLTKHCEICFKDYESRSKAYISVEEYERKILDYKNFMESNLNDFLNLMVGNMINNNDFVIFKLHNNDYNQALENLSGNLENYNKINFEVIENYKKSYFIIQSAVEIIQNQAKIECDNLKNIINDENLKFLWKNIFVRRFNYKIFSLIIYSFI